MGRVREKRRVEERRSEKRKSHKKEDADARKGRKVAKHCVFSMTTNLSYRFSIFETSATVICALEFQLACMDLFKGSRE